MKAIPIVLMLLAILGIIVGVQFKEELISLGLLVWYLAGLFILLATSIILDSYYVSKYKGNPWDLI